MLCERVLGNLDGDPTAFSRACRDMDELELKWWELNNRALRKITRDGREIRILLPIGQYLHDGDIIYDDGATIVVIRVAECEVLVVKPRNAAELGLAALEIGNLHAPAEMVGDELVVLADGPIESAMSELGVPYERTVRRLNPRRCAGMPVLAASPNLNIRRKI